jgi:hypothetical protein
MTEKRMPTMNQPKPARASVSLFGFLAVSTVVLSGCAAASASPDWDSRFGDVARQVRATQVIDPQAPSRNTDVQGIDGKAAAGVGRAYAESYGYGVKESKQPVLTLSTSGEK